MTNQPKPRTAYSTHPRVQKTFRKLVNQIKEQEQKSDLTNPLTPEEVEALRQSKKASIAYMKKVLQEKPPQEK